MDSTKVRKFMQLAGQKTRSELSEGDIGTRKLGAQLLLSETLEYVIKGLGVVPVVDGQKITDPNALEFSEATNPDPVEMLDGLADVAYTMYWNAEALGLPLDEAYELVCDNNLEKFVALENWSEGERLLDSSEWGCGLNVEWPSSVVAVSVIDVSGSYYAVGKDESGKVRKPSTYKSVDLSPLVSNTKSVVNG